MAGFEPAISRLEVLRVIHCATRTLCIVRSVLCAAYYAPSRDRTVDLAISDLPVNSRTL